MLKPKIFYLTVVTRTILEKFKNKIFSIYKTWFLSQLDRKKQGNRLTIACFKT